MNKKIALLSVALGMFASNASADALKNSLTGIMNQKEAPSVVDLGEINLNAKPRRVKHVRKTRSSKAVVATINGHKVIKKDADAHLSKRTGGKVKNFDLLPRKQQKRLIEEMALPILAMDAAQKELSDEEKQTVYTRTWMRKEALKVNITDAQLQAAYAQLKQRAIDNNATEQIPEFDLIKDKLQLQMIERTVVGKLLENAKFEVMQ